MKKMEKRKRMEGANIRVRQRLSLRPRKLRNQKEGIKNKEKMSPRSGEEKGSFVKEGRGKTEK